MDTHSSINFPIMIFFFQIMYISLLNNFSFVSGEAEILQLFTIKASKSVVKTGLLPVAGCRCIKGNIIANITKIGSILTDLGEVIYV